MPFSAQTGTGRRRSRVAPSRRCSQCRFPSWNGDARKKAAPEETAKFRKETSCNAAKPHRSTQPRHLGGPCWRAFGGRRAGYGVQRRARPSDDGPPRSRLRAHGRAAARTCRGRPPSLDAEDGSGSSDAERCESSATRCIGRNGIAAGPRSPLPADAACASCGHVPTTAMT